MPHPCNRCGTDIPPAETYSSRPKTCKECVKTAARQHRAENLEYVREYDRLRGLDPKRKEEVRKRAPKYAARASEYRRRYREKDEQRNRAHNAVNNAVRAGTLKVTPCVRCGYGVGLHAHHEDYSKQLEVMWLCKPCHGQRHREINAERRKQRAA